MTRFAYVNGRFLPFKDALIHVEERGFQFADGVYEVIALVGGKLVDMDQHLERLTYSACEIDLPLTFNRNALKKHIQELVQLNRYRHGIVYIQLSRGVAPRAFPLPSPSKTSLVMTVRPNNPFKFLETHKKGVRVITQEDPRWARPDIKTVNLLPAVLAKQNALEQGAYDTIFTKNGYVTESTSANFWCVFGQTLHTHPIAHHILNGITKERFKNLACDKGLTVIEKAFTLEDAYKADEAFLTSSNVLGLPVTQINDKIIGKGTPGSFTIKLQQAMIDFIHTL